MGGRFNGPRHGFSGVALFGPWKFLIECPKKNDKTTFNNFKHEKRKDPSCCERLVYLLLRILLDFF